MITLDNKKVHDLIVMKDGLVNDGRKISASIDDLDKKIAGYEAKERSITEKIKTPELQALKDAGDALNDECQAKFEALQEIIQKVEKIRLAQIPADMKAEHMALLKEREKEERNRNKIFLKVQKVKDKVVPIIQKEVKPLLAEYDDIETAKTKDGMVVINTFNHLVEFKKKFRK